MYWMNHLALNSSFSVYRRRLFDPLFPVAKCLTPHPTTRERFPSPARYISAGIFDSFPTDPPHPPLALPGSNRSCFRIYSALHTDLILTVDGMQRWMVYLVRPVCRACLSASTDMWIGPSFF